MEVQHPELLRALTTWLHSKRSHGATIPSAILSASFVT